MNCPAVLVRLIDELFLHLLPSCAHREAEYGRKQAVRKVMTTGVSSLTLARTSRTEDVSAAKNGKDGRTIMLNDHVLTQNGSGSTCMSAKAALNFEFEHPHRP